MVYMTAAWYERLKAGRMGKKMTVAELARLSGVSRQAIMAYEAGEVKFPRTPILAAIAEKLDLDLVPLLIDIEAQSKQPINGNHIREYGVEYKPQTPTALLSPPEMRREVDDIFDRLPAHLQVTAWKILQSLVPDDSDLSDTAP